MTTTNRFIQRIANAKYLGLNPIIAEIKKFSPLDGDLLGERTVMDVAQAYVKGGAACISVVTGKWYHGTPAILECIAESVDIPILRKDFITSKGHVRMSKELGASAVLLTRKLLTRQHFNTLVAYCIDLDLVPFIEVSDNKELEGIELNQKTVVAVNNRDIHVKETDGAGIEKSIELISSLNGCNAALRVSASGISSPSDAWFLFNAGFDALLIGTALMQSNDIEKLLFALSANGYQKNQRG